MFEVSVEAEFCAAHALVIAGERETVHGHNWKLTVTVAGAELDRDGLLVDFHALERAIAEIIGPFKNADLNAKPPFTRLNPSAEQVARYIFEEVERGLAALRTSCGAIDDHPPIWVDSVRLTEAPGCAVVYRRRTAGLNEPEGRSGR